MKPILQIKVKISGATWKVRVLSEDNFRLTHGDGLAATVPDNKTIDFIEDVWNDRIVRHETFHAYFTDLHLDDVDEIKINTIEEIMARFFESKAAEVLKTASAISRSLRRKLK